MRDYLLLAFVACLLPLCLFKPYVGVLLWNCFALLNPHRNTWGIAQTVHISLLIALAVLVASLREVIRRQFPRVREAYLLLGFWAMVSGTTLFATNPTVALPKLAILSKILLMVFLTCWIVDTRERLRGLIYVIAFSIGIYGIVGGIFALATGGKYRVYGPETSFIADNNSLALALNMTLPFFYYLAQDVRSRWYRLGLRLSFLLIAISVIFTYSRGGFLGLIAVIGFLILKSKLRYRVAFLVLAPIFIALAISFLPTQWTSRMNTITTYEQDNSAMSRLHAWRLAWNIAIAHPLTGMGFNAMEDKSLYDRYYPDSPTRGDVHSVYFEILSEHGFIVFFTYVYLMFRCLLTSRRLTQWCLRQSQYNWMKNYADIAQVALLAFLVSGTFLELATFDYTYTVIALLIIMQNVAQKHGYPNSHYLPAHINDSLVAATD